MNIQAERIFDTLVDTKRKSVSLKAKFKLRDYINQDGKSQIIMHLTGNSERERIPTDIYIEPKKFSEKTQRIVASNQVDKDYNLILDHYISKVTHLKITFKLSDLELTPSIAKSEIIGGLTRVNFVAFFKNKLEMEKVNYSEGTYGRYHSVYEKLKAYREFIPFSNIDDDFFSEYRTYCSVTLKNVKTTINGNIIALKTFLRFAVKAGIKLRIDLDDVKGGSTHGNTTYLTPSELKKFFEYYNSGFINSSHKLILGYFLFACMTGLRISDVQKIERNGLIDHELSFINTKSRADQFLLLNNKAREIVLNCDQLFIRKFPDQHINDELKKIAAICGINKRIHFHVARHTFGTCFLRKEIGGTVHHLQKLLKHKSIATTMVYAHIVETEANEQIFALDKLF